jgi:hypothetical protein
MSITFWRLLFAACITTSVFAQTANLEQLEASAGESQYQVAGELPAPEWEDRFGIPVAVLRLRASGAAAYRVSFASLHLPKVRTCFFTVWTPREE